MFGYVPQVHMSRTKIHHHGLKPQHIHHPTPIKTHQHFGIATCIYIYMYVSEGIKRVFVCLVLGW